MHTPADFALTLAIIADLVQVKAEFKKKLMEKIVESVTLSRPPLPPVSMVAAATGTAEPADRQRPRVRP